MFVTPINYERSRFLEVSRRIFYVIMSKFDRFKRYYRQNWKMRYGCFNGEQSRRAFPASWSPVRLCKFFYSSAVHATMFGKVSGIAKNIGSLYHFAWTRLWFAWAIFNICFVTADNFHDLISRSADLRRGLCANIWLNIFEPLYLMILQ